MRACRFGGTGTARTLRIQQSGQRDRGRAAGGRRDWLNTETRCFLGFFHCPPSPKAKLAWPISDAMNEPVLVIVDDDRRFAAEAADLARSRGFATHVAHSV